ncbi:MAG: hypothetical protein LBP62_05650 [Clostridiales bacterium]|jgi:hypothetical protein|nr:hypothetical protein [Clostridiales bacterium]
MPNDFKFESLFTESDYKNFIAAVERRESYSVRVGNHRDKIQVRITGQECTNGNWSPENYFWSIDVTDQRNGYAGSGVPLRIGEMKSYDELVYFIYDMLKIPHPKQMQTQLSFF